MHLVSKFNPIKIYKVSVFTTYIILINISSCVTMYTVCSQCTL